MKLKATLLSILLASAVNSYGLSFFGIAATDVAAASDPGNSSFVVVDTNDDGVAFSDSSIGVTLTSGTFIDSSDDFIIAYNPILGGFGESVDGAASFTLDTNGISAGDDFYVIFFAAKSGDGITTEAGDAFGILDGADWEVSSSNADALSYGSDLAQFNTVSADLTIVPEPSSYAFLAGALGLACVLFRRK